MRSSWAELHAEFLRVAQSLPAKKQFETIKLDRPLLARFHGPEDLVGFFHLGSGDLDEKESLYRALVEAARAPGATRQVASAILWLGLWPALDRIYNRRRKLFPHDPDECAAEIASRFTWLVDHIDLGTTTRVFAALVRGSERDVLEAAVRRRREESLCNSVASVDAVLDARRREAARRHGPTLVPAVENPGDEAPRPPPQILPFPIADVDEEVAGLRNWLHEVIGVADADLILAVTVLGEGQAEIARRLGVGHDAIRKRYQRALARLRDAVGSLSQVAPHRCISPAKAGGSDG